MQQLHLSNREKFTYGYIRLSHREEYLLQTILSLLKHKMHHEWVQDQHNPDICITNDLVDESLAEPVASERPQSRQQKIALSCLQNQRAEFGVHMASSNVYFSAQKIENALNQMGQQLLRLKKIDTVEPYSKEPVAVVPDATVPDTHVKSFRLKRWPASLIITAQQMRIASLLLGKSLTIAEIVDKSASELAFCEGFIQQLSLAGYIAETLSTASNSKVFSTELTMLSTGSITPAKSLSIFSKIRNRLTLSVFSKI